jgi:hypothetical protein
MRIAALLLALVIADLRAMPTAFIVSKSENKNQVHYAVQVSAQCLPVGPAPVQPYWRMFERSPVAIEPIKADEERAYGVASQAVDGVRVTVRLRALPARPITITTWRDARGACASSSTTAINGKPARLFNIHIALGPLGVKYILVTGWADDGSVVREKISP